MRQPGETRGRSSLLAGAGFSGCPGYLPGGCRKSRVFPIGGCPDAHRCSRPDAHEAGGCPEASASGYSVGVPKLTDTRWVSQSSHGGCPKAHTVGVPKLTRWVSQSSSQSSTSQNSTQISPIFAVLTGWGVQAFTDVRDAPCVVPDREQGLRHRSQRAGSTTWKALWRRWPCWSTTTRVWGPGAALIPCSWNSRVCPR
jgi:hypothetical protein